jgi:outer membrane protein
MKKLIIFLLAALSLNAFSQIEKPIKKGNMILSGEGSIQYYSTRAFNGLTFTNSHLLNLTLSPGVGYFIVDNLAIGVNTSFTFSSQGGYNYYVLGAGPNIRYYFNNGIFLKAETSYSFVHYSESNGSTQHGYSFSPGIGYAFFLNPKVSLEPGLSFVYNHYHYTSDQNYKTNNLLFELKFNIFL